MAPPRLEALSGRTALVTGASSGIGRAAAHALAGLGADVIMVGRHPERTAEAAQEVRVRQGRGNVRTLIFDLASLASVTDGARAALAMAPRLDILINNAGVHDLRSGTTHDGFEVTYATNYLGPFQLTRLLTPRLLKTAARHGQARVVNVSSLTHRLASRFDPADPIPHPWPPAGPLSREPYSESKLANILHADELARRHGDAGLRAHSVHPGNVATNIFRADHYPGSWQWIARLNRPFQIDAAKGAAPVIEAAAGEAASRVNGRYWTHAGEREPKRPPGAAEAARALWLRSEELIDNALERGRV